jgi:hypothetical protein
VDPRELAFGAVLIPLLLGLAGYFGWRQWRTLRALGAQSELPADERAYLRAQARRRLVCCALMVVLAGLLACTYFFEGPHQEVTQAAGERTAQGLEPTDEQKDFLRQYTLYVVLILLVLFVLLLLVAVDVWAIARFGARQHRKLRADYRAAIESELARLRRHRNGPG